ncbi:MAG: ABC transporter substrate-binding protein [Chloroflexi bacterium]|nr:ABC transporter substrate-binding protein [Chloroflexota bacterium]
MAQPPAAASVATPASASAQPKSGGTVHTGQVGDIANLDGHYSNQLSNNTVQLAYDKLAAYDAQMQPQPMLAQSWDISDDLTTFKFNLRKGVTFHNGREFTSDDVKYNIQRVQDPKLAALVATLGQQAAWFTGVETPDKYSVVLHTDKPRPGVFDFLRNFNIVDKETMEGPNAKTSINGTGPFKFVEWTSGDHITMARNLNYWQAGKPYIDQLRISILRDPQAMATQFEASSLDVMYAPSLVDAVRLKQDPRNQAVINAQGGAFFYVNLNVINPIFTDKLVRQAMNYALDRDRIASTVLQGLVGGPIDLPWPQNSPAFDAAKNNAYPFDLDKAAALLKQAGLSSVDTEITYSTANFAGEYASTAQIYQADLAKIGVSTSLKPVDGPTFTQQGFSQSYAGLRIGAGGAANVVDAASLLQGGNAYNYANNFSGFKDDVYGNLVNAASTEPDVAKRKQLYSQLNDYLLDQSFTFAYAYSPTTIVVGSTVHSLQFDASGALAYVDAWVG